MDLPSAAEARYLSRRNPRYPRLLREIHDPPEGIYHLGPYAYEAPQVALVGTRRATQYGLRVARELAAEFARRGFCVVSGLARGIDTAAHEGALSAGGPTVAVLGTGLDVVYPPENAGLQSQIAESGAVLTEIPEGKPTERWSFPRRNRIISGLSWAVIVVESALDGGAMITARLAGEQGRSLFAVPGRIDQPMSAGCHQLIREGATLLTSADDLAEELSYLPGLKPPPAACAKRAPAAELAPDEKRIRECFRDGAILSADALAAESGLAPAALAAALPLLEMKGILVRRYDGTYEAGASP